MLIAGDDADAKSTLAGIVTSGGPNAIDAGNAGGAPTKGFYGSAAGPIGLVFSYLAGLDAAQHRTRSDAEGELTRTRHHQSA